jgi:hypothetical protein
MSEARAAAERLIDSEADRGERAYGPGSLHTHNFDRDVAAVARAYLAANPADDSELIDAQFMERVGFQVERIDDDWNAERQCDPFWHPDWPDDKTYTRLIVYHDGTAHISQGPDESIEWPVKITTRGHLRNLCAVLELKEQSHD